jgi:hypothetical protein
MSCWGLEAWVKTLSGSGSGTGTGEASGVRSRSRGGGGDRHSGVRSSSSRTASPVVRVGSGSRPFGARNWDRRSATEGPGVLCCDESLPKNEDVEDDDPGRGPESKDDETGAATAPSRRGCVVGST